MSKSCTELARKFNVPFNSGKAEAGCPGIMYPIDQTSPIEFTWGFGWCNEDKKMRYDQFFGALKATEAFTERNDISGYKQLTVHGRAMVVNIANINNFKELLKAIAPIATDELDMNQIPFGKGGVTVGRIADKYITTHTARYLAKEEEFTTKSTTIDELYFSDKVEDSEDSDRQKLKPTKLIREKHKVSVKYEEENITTYTTTEKTNVKSETPETDKIVEELLAQKTLGGHKDYFSYFSEGTKALIIEGIFNSDASSDIKSTLIGEIVEL